MTRKWWAVAAALALCGFVESVHVVEGNVGGGRNFAGIVHSFEVFANTIDGPVFVPPARCTESRDQNLLLGKVQSFDKKVFLPFSGISGPRSSVSRSTLFYEVGGLTLLGVLSAFFGALGFVWVLNNADWKRKLSGGIVACIGLTGTIFFYAWGAYLHPLGFLLRL